MHESLWLWSPTVESLSDLAVGSSTPHLLLVLEGLLSQLGVRRKRVPRLLSPLQSHHQTVPAGTKSPSQGWLR